jgi:hypothetical protein
MNQTITPEIELEADVAENGTAKATKGPPKKLEYPVLTDDEGKSVLLTEVPEDFDRKRHKMLTRAQFEDPCVWLLWQAKILEDKAEVYKKEAEQIAALGTNAVVRKKATQLLKLQQQMEELTAALAAQDVDVAKILSGN